MVGWKKSPSSRSSSSSSVQSGTAHSSSPSPSLSLAEFAKYIPLRLTQEERALLTILNNALEVSEYTDHVDVAAGSRYRGGLKARRILDGILEACHISTGLAVASSQEATLATLVQHSLVEANKNGHCMEGNGEAPTTALDDLDDRKQVKKKKRKSKLLKKMKKRKGRGPKSSTSLLPPAAIASGGSSWASRDPKSNAALFQAMFEIGRRNKVLNPSSMRTTYGKLMYLLQDAQNPTVSKSLGFSLYKDMVLVHGYLVDQKAESLLDDERLVGATEYIHVVQDDGERLSREEIAARVSRKRQLQDDLVQDYSSSSSTSSFSNNGMSPDNVRRVIDSIADAIAYVESSVAPVQSMLEYLQDNFDPNAVADGFSLQLSGSSRGFSSSSSSSSYSRYGWSAFRENSGGGGTLSHSHATQYTFVWQSLSLWCKVMRHMHQLWVCADDDLLSTASTYHLYNTGQGLNRVQSCPRVGKVMRSLLSQTQQEAGASWVGLSVVHLGDRDVPNALVFIDKYTQIPRFLHPIVDFLQSLPELCQDERVDAYVKKQFGSSERLKMAVLADYFKHGFDGSGDDGGSCIDGRLTSSWNWTSRIAKKRYYHAFMLSGFQGFDGDFK